MKYHERKDFEDVNMFGTGENCSNEWCEPVSDEYYNNLK